MNFLSKVEAIHPRGKQAKTGIKRKGKLSSKKDSNTIIGKLDWLSSTLDGMIDDFDYQPKTNRLFNKAISLHGLVTDSMSLENKLSSYIELANIMNEVKSEVQRLYRLGHLSQRVDRKILHKFISVAEEVDLDKDMLAKVSVKMKEAQDELAALGLD
jgi:hypothetical protein